MRKSIKSENFRDWFTALQALAKEHGERVLDEDAWGQDYHEGKTVEESFFGEYPEHEQPTCTSQHKTPCPECPWRRNSAPGWLGASQPGEFLAQSDAKLRMPCHSVVNYTDPNWKDKANNAHQCAGRAIFQANRAQHPGDGNLKLPADHKAVFTRPHEFVAHHTRQDPKNLEQVLIFDLYNVTK